MCSELSYNSVRIAHQVREHEERKSNERKRHLLCLVIQHLRDEGCMESARLAAKESGLGDQYEVCDNIDLATIVKEFEDYYFVRFQKHPKLCKRVDSAQEAAAPGAAARANTRKRGAPSRKATWDAGSPPTAAAAAAGDATSPAAEPFELTVLAYPLSLAGAAPLAGSGAEAGRAQAGDDPQAAAERLLRPVAGLAKDPEWRRFAEIISRDIFVHNPNVRWDDIKGLQEPKRLLKEAVVYPTKYPELFSGILAPWKGLLLYGPSGTGKTLVAKAVATECGTTFFNVSASTLVSKWRGDSEKLVRVLFELARLHAPSTIFLDEVDALASRRGLAGEHEATRRLQAELLVQLDGLNGLAAQRADEHADGQRNVFLLVTSNLPWDLDEALLRRLEKRILVDLPDLEAREQILQHYLPPAPAPARSPAPKPRGGGARPTLVCQLDYARLAQETDGYSGADLRLVCKEAAMQSVRGVFSHLESGIPDCSSLQLDAVTTASVRVALARTRPCGSRGADRYRTWQQRFGAS